MNMFNKIALTLLTKKWYSQRQKHATFIKLHASLLIQFESIRAEITNIDGMELFCMFHDFWLIKPLVIVFIATFSKKIKKNMHIFHLLLVKIRHAYCVEFNYWYGINKNLNIKFWKFSNKIFLKMSWVFIFVISRGMVE